VPGWCQNCTALHRARLVPTPPQKMFTVINSTRAHADGLTAPSKEHNYHFFILKNCMAHYNHCQGDPDLMLLLLLGL
jgi:hypothetical protein